MLSVIATDVPRLINCNGSRLMGATLPPVDATDATKDEGKAADWVVAQIHNGKFTEETIVGEKSPEGIFITSEMVEYLSDYLWAIAGGMIETNTSHGGNGWYVRGRADASVYNLERQHLTIGELKYGWRIVEPEMNWTLISHVAGFIANNPEFPVKTIDLTVFQPRPHHHGGPVRTWPISISKFTELYNHMAATLQSPDNALHTGEIQCHYCPALATCPAARAASAALAAARDFPSSMVTKALIVWLCWAMRPTTRTSNADNSSRGASSRAGESWLPAITTTDITIRIAWLIPSMIDDHALGSSTMRRR